MRIFLLFAVFIVSTLENYSQKIDVQAYAQNGKTNKQEPVAQVIVEEFLNEKSYALLNYVFFEENSSDIPNKYKQFQKKYETEYFIPEKKFFNYEVLDVYYHLLNIVGYRLQKSPQEKIKLVASNSSKGSEKDNVGLSKARAEKVKKYIIDIWGIEPLRIEIDDNQGHLPLNASNTKSEFGEEENRRVEIQASWEILKPLYISDTVKKSNPPVIYFYNKIEGFSNISQYKLNIKQGSKEFKFNGTSIYGKPKDIIEWRLQKDKDLPTGNSPLLYRNSVMSNKLFESEMKRLPVKYTSLSEKKKYKKESKEFKRFNLILFDFGKAEINKNNEEILKMIKNDESIKKNSNIYISGYTDTLGNEEINIKLALKRAESIKEKLLSYGVNANFTSVTGSSKVINPYNNSILNNLTVVGGEYIDPEKDVDKLNTIQLNYNDFPEGRYYCRTVIIEVENIIGEEK